MDQNLSPYELMRKRNMQDNRKLLASLGLQMQRNVRLNPSRPVAPRQRAPKRKAIVLEDPENCGSIRGVRRKSARLQGKSAPTVELPDDEDDISDKENDDRPVTFKRPNSYGHIEGIEIGTVWMTRMECNKDGIHRPTVAGIHPGPEGAYSIALSGRYDDNVDMGEGFTYTGEGGRHLKGLPGKPKNLREAPQTKDQELSLGNEALCRSKETGVPVRVIRGYKLQSPYAPQEGYRYDGLYTVQKAWYCTGLSGFKVWKFALKRVENQAPPPWTYSEDGTDTRTACETVDDATASENVDDATASENVDDATASENVDDATASENVDDATASENVDDATASENVEDGPNDAA